MYEILNSFKQKSIPKFQQKLINFEKNPKVFKNPKTKLRKLENRLERGLEWERVFREVKRQVCWERDREKWEGNRDSCLNRSLVNLNR